MGQLLSLVRGDPDHDITIDFENAQPNQASRSLFEKCESTLARSSAMLELLRGYGQGCTQEIRVALSQPSEANDRIAWAALVPKVAIMKQLHQYSSEIGAIFPELLHAICSEDPMQSIQDQQALAKQLAHMFDFALKFDELKMQCPQLQNDFAFYRRNVGRVPAGVELPIRDDDATVLSMYFANPNPMTSTLTLSVTSSANKARMTPVLAAIASICQSMLSRRTYETGDVHTLVIRCMVASVVLYDHIDERGAFHKKSPINIPRVVKVLKQSPQRSTAETLINTLRYSTKTLNSPDTPTNITDLFK
eukprot:c5878_g1_i1.p1 GENE.c5878_g1_i1~~c5878_g1_i1.p1  ORF type:complete len:306 (-),score=48.07 c5878_g1_i1:350-1267(-)